MEVETACSISSIKIDALALGIEPELALLSLRFLHQDLGALGAFLEYELFDSRTGFVERLPAFVVAAGPAAELGWLRAATGAGAGWSLSRAFLRGFCIYSTLAFTPIEQLAGLLPERTFLQVCEWNFADWAAGIAHPAAHDSIGTLVHLTP